MANQTPQQKTLRGFLFHVKQYPRIHISRETAMSTLFYLTPAVKGNRIQDMLTADFVTGFLHAASGFCGVASGKEERPYFLVYCDDAAVAEELQSFFCAGSIYRNKARVMFRVTKNAELLGLVSFCDQISFLGSVSQKYQEWRVAVLKKNGIAEQ